MIAAPDGPSTDQKMGARAWLMLTYDVHNFVHISIDQTIKTNFTSLGIHNIQAEKKKMP